MRRTISAALILMLMSLTVLPVKASNVPPGWDVPLKRLPAPWDSHWAADTLSILWSIGFLTDEDVEQDPDRPLSRGHFAAWVAQASGLAPFRPVTPTFRDVSADSPHMPWIESLVQAGAIRGYPDGTYRPHLNVVRSEMAAVLRPFSTRLPVRADRVAFTDTIGHWAEADIREVARRGLLTGYPDGSFGPDQTATFAEGATIILRLMAGTADPKVVSIRLMLQLQQGRQSHGLVTVGAMAAIIAQNYFDAPLLTTGRAAVSYLQRQGIPVRQHADAVLTVIEFTDWVTALETMGLLDELADLDADPDRKPASFAVDLQVVRDALSGTLMPQTQLVQAMAGACFEAVGIQPDPQAKLVTGIPADRAFMIHPSPSNRPPVAAFEVTSPVHVGETVEYTDLSYDPDGDAIVRLWSGNQLSFVAPGRYTVSLLVVDPSGASAGISREVEVLARPNRAPAAYFAAPNVVIAGEPVSYRTMPTDLDGDQIVDEEWTGKRSVFHTPGTYTVSLRVKDARGEWSAPYARTITVIAPPSSAGTVSASPNPARRGEDVVLTITCGDTAYQAWVDVPSALESISVSFGDGQTVRVSNPDGWAAGGNGSFSFKATVPWTADRPADGTYRFTVTVHHRQTVYWDHIHDGIDNDLDGLIDEDDEQGMHCTADSEPPCHSHVHTHSETYYWTSTHSVDLVIRGRRDVITPGR